ncbi:DNA repair protein RecO (recombination protein O) [Trueperella bonasi]|uniref:DNA repair protein RecO n=1 Tax=Trueperella bonasi TaxID=312286 RepID=A0ABT9NE44_9ACTO|nr:DNA repair protein RecO [Trueperella bonasi]MDP9805604.1 DNA repair protein RecO (recombination protein O) [Trueperella bonasi]
MKTYRDDAIVLRQHDLGEADRIITMLSRGHGKIRAVAKGVRRTKSRFGARVEPFALVDIQLYKGRNLDTITQVESRNQYGRTLSTNYDAYTAASAMLELADRLTGDDPDLEQFQLLHGALHAAATGKHTPDLVLGSYMLRAMALSGWELAIFECAICGVPGPHEALHVPSGGAVCDDCRPPGSTIPTVDTWQLIGALNEGDWKIVDRADVAARKSAGPVISAFVQWQLETKVKSLRLVSVDEGA